MSEFPLERTPDKTVAIRPDEDGFTIRTRFEDTQRILDDNARQRSVDPNPEVFAESGVVYRKVGSIPMEVIHRWIRENGGKWPTNEEMLQKLRNRDFSKLRSTDRRF